MGDLWVNLGAVALDKVLDSPLRPSLEAYLRRAPVPDEAFTPSVLFNGAPSIRAVRDSRRFIRWPVTPSRHPLPVVESDLPALRASTAFFARKIDPIRHAGMCAELDALAQDAERT